SRYSSQSRLLLSSAFQYSRTTGLVHHDVSTFHRVIGTIDPLKAPEIAIGAPPWSIVTSMAVGGESRRVILSTWRRLRRHLPMNEENQRSPLRRSVPATAPALR